MNTASAMWQNVSCSVKLQLALIENDSKIVIMQCFSCAMGVG